jgi:uncharacterized protein
VKPLFDATTWVGRWPFAFLPEYDGAGLRRALEREQIGRALVSPLGAVFAPEPSPANRELLITTRRQPGLIPVPVINPVLPNWQEELDRVAQDERVRAVRWLPSYHDYTLSGRAVDSCLEELTRRRLRLVVTARLIDERHEYFALRIKGVPAAKLGAWLARHADLPVLVTGLYYREILTLAPSHPHLLADLSLAEWDRTAERLIETVPARQLVFGSHSPFLVPAAGVAKVRTARLPLRDRNALAHGNLNRFLSS